ncbi:hypothetical protein [Streptomyces sp. NBC_01768]|uniref:hypothetical protein n=1 Tax=Streptomyces sp. NBC_01768 TaxID=2975938 RepID=UPI002DDB3BDD|nr:hypothetical protein [Streptomyces sp. NBC_01768]WSC31795.1 hypothetical protein OG902_36680 [Streptomyces sp. NBC_01768]
MAMYTFGGTPSDVLTLTNGDVVADYPVVVRVAGTGAVVTSMFEMDGTTPISQLRSNPASSTSPGAIRAFRVDGVAEIEYELNAAGGNVVRWYQVGREVATGAAQAAASASEVADAAAVNAAIARDHALSADSQSDAALTIATIAKSTADAARAAVLASASTISKSIVVAPGATGTYPIWRAPRECTITAVHGYRVGGTGASINATVDTVNVLSTDLSLSTASTWLSGPTVATPTIPQGATLMLAVRAASGSPTSVSVQVDITISET